MHSVPLVATTRGYPGSGHTIENVHMGSVAVTDPSGTLLWWAGDPSLMTFTRSALKPFQALPFMLDDGPARFGFEQADLAMLCASHSGEAMHVQQVQGILAKIGLDQHALACGCHVPLYYESVGASVPEGHSWSPLQHNCSGKHSGFLAWCRLHGVAHEHYADRAHPLQQALRTRLADTLGLPASALPCGMDGCGAPNYAMPLARLAQLYARLARGHADPQLGSLLGELGNAMTAHPALVSGQARCDLDYMQAGRGDWVSKVGADAVQTLGIRSAGLGIAIKIADGAKRALQCATYSVLDQLGLLDAERRSLLAHYRAPPIINGRGAETGTIRAMFALQKAGSD